MKTHSKKRNAAFVLIRAQPERFTVRGIAIELAKTHGKKRHMPWMPIARRAIAALVDAGEVTRLREGGGGAKALYEVKRRGR